MAVVANHQQSDRTFTVETSEFKFVPSTLEVTEGEVIRFIVKNIGTVPHEFELKEFGVESVIQQGKSVTVTVHPTKAGMYKLYGGRTYSQAKIGNKVYVKPLHDLNLTRWQEVCLIPCNAHSSCNL